MLLLLVSVFVGLLGVLLLSSLCGRSKPSTSADASRSSKSSRLDPYEQLAKKKRNSQNALSPIAQELKVMLGLSDQRLDVSVSVDMEKIYDPCYKGMDKIISALSEFCIVYLLVRSTTDKEQEHQTKEVLAQLPHATIPPHRVLHHETPVGKIAFARQIKPHLHVEFDEKAFLALRPHLPLVVFHRCSSAVDLDSKPYPHQIESFEELVNVELKI